VIKSVDTLKQLNLLCWPVLVIGFQKKWVSKNDIEDYAISLLDNDPDQCNNISILASAGFLESYEIETLLLKINLHIEPAEALDMWRLAVLITLKNANYPDDQKISELQQIYSEFEYPEDMQTCSIYSQDNIDPLIAMSDVIKLLKNKFSIK